jgi:membrane protein
MKEKAASKIHSFWSALRWYWDQLIAQFMAHDCLSSAAALTYTTLFAVVPMMTVAYTAFSILPAYEGLEERIEAFIFNNFVPDSSAAVKEKLLEFSDRARGLTAAGFVFLFLTSFLLLVTIEKTFNAIWQVPQPRKGLQRVLVYWGVLSLGPPMIVFGILLSAYFASLQLISDLDVFGFRALLLSYLPLLLTWVGFTILYWAMPNCRVRLLHAILGGLLTVWFFELAKYVFNYGVSNTSLASIYGTFAAVPFFLFWMYMVWVLVLAGAIFVRTMSLRREPVAADAEPMLVKCSRVLHTVLQGHLEGRPVSDEEIQETVLLTGYEKERIFSALGELKLLARDEEDNWLLSRSLKTLTLWDLYQVVPEGLDADRLDEVEGMENVVEPLKSLLQFGSNQMAVSLDSVFGGAT